MSSTTKIEWTDRTWNPVTGCTKVSPGCDRCYAEVFAERFRNVPGAYFEGGFDLILRPNMMNRPLTWRRPSRIFVNSMSDLFHSGVPDSYVNEVFDVMEKASHHSYQVLTKRPERLGRFMRARYGDGPIPSHVWLGVSVENNDYSWRVNMLRAINAPIRFLSVEPMLGPVDLVDFSGISWIIVGGESGRGRRTMDAEWVRAVRDRCVADGIPFFFKQWHKAGTGRDLDGRIWDQLPDEAKMAARR